MSVFIKGMEMPTDRSRWVVIYPDGKVEYSDKTDKWETLDKGAVPVPPHGRLIDADALFEKVYKAWGTEYDAGESNWFMDMINEAPTIIPAEEAQQ